MQKKGGAFAAVVLGDDVIGLRSTAWQKLTTPTASKHCWKTGTRISPRCREIVARLEKDGRPGAFKLSDLKALPPVRRPGKMFYAAQNFQEHVDEMLRAGMTPRRGPKFPARNRHQSRIYFSKPRAH